MIGSVLIGKYEIQEELSASAIFHSYRARDVGTNVEVCIRVVNPPLSTEPEFLIALKKVTERAMQLDHPNIAKVYGLFEDNGTPFLVCELVVGSTLVDRIRRIAPFSPAVACETVIGICEALQYASFRGMAHGDLCADHVLTSLDGRVAIIDFGLWESYSSSLTAGGMVLSRMAPYLAPEVIEGTLPNATSDVYAVGVILFELLTGRLPFTGPTPMSILAKHGSKNTPSVRTTNPSVPQPVDEIVMKALEKNPLFRYSSASDLLVDLYALRDALRFGKPLSWPLQGTEKPVFPSTPIQEPLVHTETRKTVVSTKPGGTPAKKTVVSKPKKPPRDDDVPIWLRALVFFGAGVLVAGVILYMVANLTKKRIVEVPNFIGMNYAEARDKAKASGIKLAITKEEYNDKYPQPDMVISMDPVPTMKVYEGSVVNVTRSLGATEVDVPDLQGVTRDEARRRLTASGLKVSADVKEERSDLDVGLIISSDPGRGERVDRGTSVRLTVSSGRERPKPDENPDDTEPRVFTLRFKVRESDEDVMVRVEMTDATDEKKVILEEPRTGGDDVWLEGIQGVGKEATFRIYFNDSLWRTIKREGTKE